MTNYPHNSKLNNFRQANRSITFKFHHAWNKAIIAFISFPYYMTLETNSLIRSYYTLIQYRPITTLAEVVTDDRDVQHRDCKIVLAIRSAKPRRRKPTDLLAPLLPTDIVWGVLYNYLIVAPSGYHQEVDFNVRHTYLCVNGDAFYFARRK